MNSTARNFNQMYEIKRPKEVNCDSRIEKTSGITIKIDSTNTSKQSVKRIVNRFWSTNEQYTYRLSWIQRFAIETSSIETRMNRGTVERSKYDALFILFL